MEKIELGDSLLGFIPNLTQKRKITEQRLTSVLEKSFNYSGYFQANEDKLHAVYDRKTHVVRLLFTEDYHSNDSSEKFDITERLFNVKTGEELSKHKELFWINDYEVSKTEYDFGKYLDENFGSLEEILDYSQKENTEIQQIVAEKEQAIQEQNQKRQDQEKQHKAAQSSAATAMGGWNSKRQSNH